QPIRVLRHWANACAARARPKSEEQAQHRRRDSRPAPLRPKSETPALANHHFAEDDRSGSILLLRERERTYSLKFFPRNQLRRVTGAPENELNDATNISRSAGANDT